MCKPELKAGTEQWDSTKIQVFQKQLERPCLILCQQSYRVNMAGNRERHSLQLFSVPKIGYPIEAPKELVNEQHPKLFKPYDFLAYAQHITIRENRGVPDVLKAFVGI